MQRTSMMSRENFAFRRVGLFESKFRRQACISVQVLADDFAPFEIAFRKLYGREGTPPQMSLQFANRKVENILTEHV